MTRPGQQWKPLTTFYLLGVPLITGASSIACALFESDWRAGAIGGAKVGFVVSMLWPLTALRTASTRRALLRS